MTVRWCLKVGLSAGLFILPLFWVNDALAQRRPVADDTLSNERSRVTPRVINGIPGDRITGGARRGSNLFHSFREFNIDERRSAYFESPDGVQNILSRVTGNGRSDILGRLGVIGNANLFLINPNGILFGRGASLDVAGSFVVTTANGVWLGSEGLFSASRPETSILLSIQPSALFFNALSNQAIVNQSQARIISQNRGPAQTVGLRVPSGRTLALIGGSLLSEGGTLTASGGRIELGSIDRNGLVRLVPINQGWQFEYNGGQNFGDILLTRGIEVGTLQRPKLSTVDISGEGGGSIEIRGGRILLNDSQILSSTSGTRGGDISIRGNYLEIGSSNNSIEGSLVQTATSSSDRSGDIRIEARRFDLRTGGSIATRTFGSGRGGNINVRVSEVVNLSSFPSLEFGQPDTGIFSASFRSGRAGNISVHTNHLTLREGTQISTSASGSGSGGDINIVAAGSVRLTGTASDNFGTLRSGLNAESRGSGFSGTITIRTSRLTVRSGAQIGVGSSPRSAGRGGSLSVTASDFVEIAGTSPDRRIASGLFAQTRGNGEGGALNIRTNRLFVRDGGQIFVGAATTSSTGKGGNLSVTAADLIELTGSPNRNLATGIFTQNQGVGATGNLSIDVGRLIVRNRAQISTGTFRPNRQPGGSLRVTARELIELSGSSRLTTDTGGASRAGDLDVQTRRLIVREGSIITGGTNGEGSGANLNITAFELIDLSDFSADGPSGLRTDAGPQATGRAGNLTINTPRLVLRGGAQAGTGTFGVGRGGDFNINASSIEITGSPPGAQGRSGLFTETNGAGPSGNLNLITQELLVRGRSEISVSSEQRSGRAGDLGIFARTVFLDDEGLIRSESELGSGGNISLRGLDLLLLRRGSQISTSAGTLLRPGDGGNLGIGAGFVVAVPSENSDIRANAFRALVWTKPILGLLTR